MKAHTYMDTYLHIHSFIDRHISIYISFIHTQIYTHTLKEKSYRLSSEKMVRRS